MKSPIREKKQTLNGVEYPIECLYRECGKSTGNFSERAPHFHDYIEFLYGLNCDVTTWVSGKKITFKSGDLLVINSNAAHNFFHNLNFNDYICIKFLPQMIYFSDNSLYDIKYVAPFLEGNIFKYHFFDKNLIMNTEIPNAVCGIQNEWAEKKFGYEISIKSKILSIFLWIIRHNHSQSREKMEDFPSLSDKSVGIISRSLDYINANISSLTEAEAAEEAGISYSYYSRLFKKVMGKSFGEYLQGARINMAEKLLLTTDMSITEVAYAAGYSTSSHFISLFKKYRNITPNQYKNSAKSLRKI